MTNHKMTYKTRCDISIYMPDQKLYSIQLLNKKMIAHDVMELKFSKPIDFMFLAGQFVEFQIHYGKEVTICSYSIASIPNSNYLEFCVKLSPFSKATNI